MLETKKAAYLVRDEQDRRFLVAQKNLLCKSTTFFKKILVESKK